jgi:hypothetical protein
MEDRALSLKMPQLRRYKIPGMMIRGLSLVVRTILLTPIVVPLTAVRLPPLAADPRRRLGSPTRITTVTGLIKTNGFDGEWALFPMN